MPTHTPKHTPALFVGDLSDIFFYKAPYKIQTNMLYKNRGININNITVH